MWGRIKQFIITWYIYNFVSHLEKLDISGLILNHSDMYKHSPVYTHTHHLLVSNWPLTVY